MSGLKQELGLAQGIGLLSTSLLGTGVFAVPALAALVAGNNSLWAWPVLIILVFPIAIVFAILGRHYPSAAASRTSSVWRLVRGLSESPAGCFYRSFPWVCLPRYKLPPGSARRCLAGIAGNCCWQNSVRWRWCGISVLAVPVPVQIYKPLLPDLSSH
ncbi:inner membrane protein YjeH [Escherichia coli ECA-0157]|nr:inner membrane protein YjeH [Escherichia coli ECA-0157]